MLGHAIALCDQCTAEFGHQFLAGILFRAERCRLETVENTLGAGGVDHFMKQRSVKGFSGLELFFFGHDYLVSRNRVVCFVLMFRFDGTNPKLVPNHRIDGHETEMFAVFDPFPVLYLQLLPQLRSCLPQVGLGDIEHPEHLHTGINIVLRLLLVGELLVIVILDFFLCFLVYAGECGQHHGKGFLTFQHRYPWQFLSVLTGLVEPLHTVERTETGNLVPFVLTMQEQ